MPTRYFPDTVSDAKLSGRDLVEKPDGFVFDSVAEDIVQNAGGPILGLLELQLEETLLHVPELDHHLGDVGQVG